MIVGDVWPIVHTERAALVADLEGLTDAQWEQSSLCTGWSVHDVAAHLVDVARTTRLGFLATMARARFDFDRQNADGVRRHRGATPQQTLSALREVIGRTSTPPAPLDSRIVEEIVHGEDIRRPLGITRAYPVAAVARALVHQVGTKGAFGGAREAVSGVRLLATDADVSIGDGPEVTGPALSLLMATSRRAGALDDLTGPGLGTLARAL